MKRTLKVLLTNCPTPEQVRKDWNAGKSFVASGATRVSKFRIPPGVDVVLFAGQEIVRRAWGCENDPGAYRIANPIVLTIDLRTEA